jgi:hypothetical protein
VITFRTFRDRRFVGALAAAATVAAVVLVGIASAAGPA